MHNHESRAMLAAVLLAITICSTATAQIPHGGDLWVARTNGDQLRLSPEGFDPENNYINLIPAGGLFPGWGDNDPGFDHVTADNAGLDVYQLETGTEVWIELVSVDPAFRIIDLGLNIIDDPGESTELGGAGLHIHNNWHVSSTHPEFDPDQCVWHGTFVLRDFGGTAYSDSEEFDVTVTNVPWGPARSPAQPADGDFDGSNMVDSGDVPALAECMSAPGSRTQPDDPAITLCEVECVNAFDFNEDLDVDLEDAAEFQNLFGS